MIQQPPQYFHHVIVCTRQNWPILVLLNILPIYDVVVDHLRVLCQEVMQNFLASQNVCAKL